MNDSEFEIWLLENTARFASLTGMVVSTARNLLSENNVPFLTIEGRTKEKASCIEKRNRKKYHSPKTQMTDISGIRIIVYFERHVEEVCEILTKSFRVDKKNSLDKHSVLSANEVGYRSIHYVCDIGKVRSSLPEFKKLKDLKFEIQVRTVLQHAWAELAHDGSYKFSGSLPKDLERKLFLLSGMLEMADGGFNDLSKQLDSYIQSLSNSASAGNLDIELNSIALEHFVRQWADSNNMYIEYLSKSDGFGELLIELNQYGIKTLRDLNSIIPINYAKEISGSSSTIFGIVRDWMTISDPAKFLSKVKIKWFLSYDDVDLYKKFLDKSSINAIISKIEVEDEDGDYGSYHDF